MRTARLLPLASVVALALGGCQIKDDGDNLVNGKTLFVEKCGSCHVLERAATTGNAGPNLDEAFQRSRKDGLGESTFAGVILKQIQQPARTSQFNPVENKPGAFMPANLVVGEDAEDVAAYVAMAAARPGKDPGQLASIGARKAEGVARPENGVLDIPADPGGGLAYVFAAAQAEAGEVTLRSPNESTVPHNIAVEGGGLDEKGPVVQGGAVSEIKVSLKKGEYTFYCSVEGHREGGMLGKLTVR